MQLNRLTAAISPLSVIGNTEQEILQICYDSRRVAPGSLFVALSGTQTDGHQYIKQALAKGAAAIVYQHLMAKSEDYAQNNPGNVPLIEVADSHDALGALAACFYDYPSRRLHLVGITGTNGKTTTVTLLFRLFRQLGYSCGLFSTIINYIDDTTIEATHTTPDPLEINQLLSKMCDHGCSYCFMEVSSHALAQGRISHLDFTGALFSNITHDHLDYHKTFAEYLKSKKRFFDELSPNAFALVNTDDKNGMVMVQNCSAKIVTYSCQRLADFNAKILEHGLDGMLLEMDGTQMWSSFIGAHNVYNLLTVYGCARLLGAEKEECLKALSAMSTVPGRLEYVKGKNGITAFVDYAHTPDALENVLKTLREILKPGQELICVVGCGGNRDKSKRPEMAQIADQYATRCFFTSDNPRFEDPDAILTDMMNGLSVAQQNKHLWITNRREAIKTAILTAKPNTIILVAGKGHEDYQIIQGIKNHFDDKEIINEFINL